MITIRAAMIAFLLLVPASGLAARKPNILVIVSDDHGYCDLGVHGCKDVRTPNLDSLAASGVRFTDGYVTGAYCSPTRAALLTGRYQNRFGHEFNHSPGTQVFGLPVTEKTLADRLKAVGYVTGVVGKWHLGTQPQFHPFKRGFDELFGFLDASQPYLNNKADAKGPIVRGTRAVDEQKYLTDAFQREALAFVERHRGRPWFLYWAFNAPHTPMQATDKYLQRFADVPDRDRRVYAAMLSALDDAVGAMLARLRTLELDNDTLVFFLSDNGGSLRNGANNAPLRGNKGELWEGGIRVPFMVRWTGQLPAGAVFRDPVIQLDVAATALAAAGVQIRPEWKLDGVNLIPHLKGQTKSPPHEALYWRFGPQMAIRKGDWKLVKAPGGALRARRNGGQPDSAVRRFWSRLGGLLLQKEREEKIRWYPATPQGAQLFNLRRYIGESNDVAGQHPEKVQELAAAWKAWNADLVPPRWLHAAATKYEDARPVESPPPRN